MFEWINHTPLWVLWIVLLVLVIGTAALGRLFYFRHQRYLTKTKQEASNETEEGYVVGGVLTLLAFIIGITFALAMDRFETRRLLVVDDAAAIRAVYLQSQLLDEPHRSRFSKLLIHYTDNHIRLGEANPDSKEMLPLLKENSVLIADLWTITVPAFDSIRGIDFSSTFVDSVTQVATLNARRVSERTAYIPGAVMFVLFVYLISTAFVMGYVLKGANGQLTGSLLLALLTMAVILLSDINRPSSGTIRESQDPLKNLQFSMEHFPPSTFDRLRPPKTP